MPNYMLLLYASEAAPAEQAEREAELKHAARLPIARYGAVEVRPEM